MNLANSIDDSGIRLRSILSTSRTAFKDNSEGLETWLATSNLSSKDREKVIKYHKKKRRQFFYVEVTHFDNSVNL